VIHDPTRRSHARFFRRTGGQLLEQIYGDANKWRTIYQANTDKIKNPDLIHPGQVLTIPPA
jgi:nucleoid-associated protein YgaU